MSLEPRVRTILRLIGPFDRLDADATVADRRRAIGALSARFGATVMARGPEPAQRADHLVPVAGGRIRVRIYRPHGAGPFPLHVFVHGGGWCQGSIEQREPRCRAISHHASCVVASIDYRLAPENAFPTAPEDCYAALLWLVEHADRLGIDPNRVAVGGESAGANLAAVLCLMARDRSGPTICHQWLDVPALDLTLSQPAVHEVADEYLMNADLLALYYDSYLDGADPQQAYASPLFGDLQGLPPAWIMSAEFDKLRDDGPAYADALRQAGVVVHDQVLAGHIHHSFAFTRTIPTARRYETDAVGALRSAFAAAASS